MMDAAGAKPAFKNYFVPAAGERYKYVLCTSVNDEIVHGMPNPKRLVKKGDIVTVTVRAVQDPGLDVQVGDDGAIGFRELKARHKPH